MASSSTSFGTDCLLLLRNNSCWLAFGAMRYEKQKSLNLSTICSQTRCARLTQRWADPRPPFYPHWRHRGSNTCTIQTGTSPCCFLRRHLYHSWIQECYMCICCDWSLQKTERKGLGKAAAWKKQQPRRQWGWIGDSAREKAVQVTSEFSSWKIPSKDDWCPCHPLSIAGSALHSQFLIFTWTAA